MELFRNSEQDERLSNIKAGYAAGEITQEQYDELLADEQTTAHYIRLKRVAMAVFLGTIGFLMLW